jgi:DNA-binding IclR family transcriptional regulator
VAGSRQQNGDGRTVVASVFELLHHVAASEPARLVDLAAATGIPRPTVHRLLQQLVAEGAVCRDGHRYRLGAGVLALSARIRPERRLCIASWRPMADLAAATGAEVCLTATIGDDAIYLENIAPRGALSFPPQPGDRLTPGSAEARLHASVGASGAVVDVGGVLANVSCVAVPLSTNGAGVAAVRALVTAPQLPPRLLAATQSTAKRIAVRLARSATTTNA